MELDKRNKRVVVTDAQVPEKDRLKKLKKQECGAAKSGRAAVDAPEDEVEEFFAILRRMKEAVRCFDGKGKGGKEWTESLKKAENAIADDDAVEVAKNNEELVVNRGWDLNVAAPEAADSGGIKSE